MFLYLLGQIMAYHTRAEQPRTWKAGRTKTRSLEKTNLGKLFKRMNFKFLKPVWDKKTTRGRRRWTKARRLKNFH